MNTLASPRRRGPHRLARATHVVGATVSRRSSLARSRPLRSRSYRIRHRETAASRRARPECGADRRRFFAPARRRPARQIVAQQHVFGRNGGVGLQLEQKMSVGALRRQQRRGRAVDRAFEDRASLVVLRSLTVGYWPAAIRSAARLPDRIAPSMVAGSPVSVQSPASTRLRHSVWRRAVYVLRRRGRESRAPLTHDLPRWQGGRQAGHARYVAPRSFWRVPPAENR